MQSEAVDPVVSDFSFDRFSIIYEALQESVDVLSTGLYERNFNNTQETQQQPGQSNIFTGHRVLYVE